MRQSAIFSILVLAATVPATTSTAHPTGEATTLLCSNSSAVVCYDDGECESGPAWLWNLPDFFEVDLDARTLTTTAESPRLRTTPIDVVRRDDGLLLLQGLESARAFSIVIADDIGSMSAAIILENQVISVFGACTPAPRVR